MMQATQYGGLRPYAVSLLLGGIDDEPHLYEIEPGASFLGYKADAIGSGKKLATEILMKEYKDNMDLDAAIALGVKIIKKVSDVPVTEYNVDIGYVQENKEFTLLTSDKIKPHI